MIEVQEKKRILRREIREEIAGFEAEYIERSDNEILKRLFECDQLVRAPRVFAYYSVGREVSTRAIIERCFEMGKKIALPVVIGGGDMYFAELPRSGAALENGGLDIPQPTADAEPDQPRTGDVIIVPALCFDSEGYRLGQGGGYYDRFLYSCDAFSIGLGREALLRKELPREAHDLAVDLVVCG